MLIHLLAEWRKCGNEVCPDNSHCLMHPAGNDKTCKCNDGYFGKPKEPYCKSTGKLTSYSAPQADLSVISASYRTVETHRTITRRNRVRGTGKQQKIQHSNRVSRFYSQIISSIDFSKKNRFVPIQTFINSNLPTVVTQHPHMLQGESHVSRGPILF